ncbi:MAG: FAD-dependent oxidoreductase, partial [Pseudomonadota bacterium]
EGAEGVAFEGCNLCLVEVDGREGLIQSCRTPAENGIRVRTDSEELRKAREKNLIKLLLTHPHACLVCAQSQGCDRKICSLQIPEPERCCFKFGVCELQKVANFIGIEKGLPPYQPLNLPVEEREPLLKRDYNLCIGCLRCVRACKEVRGANALGFTVQEGRVVVGSKGPTLSESGCQFCGYCVEICPTGALSDKEVRAGKREDYLVPCRNHCPAGIDVPGYMRFVREGEPEEALRVIYEKVPLPAVLGRVCFHPCETACRRGSLDEPVAICALKRIAADVGTQVYPRPAVGKKDGKKVAVIGSGPAGLAAAYYLAAKGHEVTVIERLPVAGGMLSVGIPEYRLPRDILAAEIKAIEGLGVQIKTGLTLGQDVTVEGLKNDGFQALFVATGLHRSLGLKVEGEDLPGVLKGVEFLRAVSLGNEVNIGKRVIVIGGGNVAVDVARSSLRVGAREVTLVCLEQREEMPAWDEEIEEALEEGVTIINGLGPKRFLENQGKVSGVEFMRCTAVFDDKGAFRPRYDDCELRDMEADTVIVAVGQRAEVPDGVVVSAGRFKMELDGEKGLFIGGDLLTGPKTVIEAIASGRDGAVLIDKFLGGDGDIGQVFSSRGVVPLWTGPGAVEGRRSPMPMRSAKERVSNFEEVCLGFEKEAATTEAGRCLRCDLRFQLEKPALPPERLQAFSEENIKEVKELEGVYILYDENKEIYKICGVENLREAVLEELENSTAARYFDVEEDPMFTGRERQLTQQYMKQTGKMPPGNSELDDLF